MASGHVNRTNRPNTWLHRPTLRREDSSCQPGAVHTWPVSTVRCDAEKRPVSGVKRQSTSRARNDVNDADRTLRAEATPGLPPVEGKDRAARGVLFCSIGSLAREGR
jgi:hypothetical protein